MTQTSEPLASLADTEVAIREVERELARLDKYHLARREWMVRRNILAALPGLTCAQVTAIMSGDHCFSEGTR